MPSRPHWNGSGDGPAAQRVQTGGASGHRASLSSRQQRASACCNSPGGAAKIGEREGSADLVVDGAGGAPDCRVC